MGHRPPGPGARLAPPRTTGSGPILHVPPREPEGREGRSCMKTGYLVVWWVSQTPHCALFENQEAAKAAASVRNALMVTISGSTVGVHEGVDWDRRNGEGSPLPAGGRDGLGPLPVPWGSNANPAPGLRGVAVQKGGVSV